MKRNFPLHRSLLAVAVLVTSLASAAGTHADDASAQKEFFENMKKLCGQSFEGITEFPQNADHPMVGKKLVISVAACSADQIRIPLQVGEDKSRTWILTLSEKGLLLKHDHRHPDGTPDKQTNYGGWAMPKGSAEHQLFAADEETAKLIPAAATNVWTLEIDPEKKRFTYALERDKAPRFKAVFSLKAEMSSAGVAEEPGARRLLFE